MQWSQLPRRKKQLVLSTGVLVLALVFGLSVTNSNKQQVGADTSLTGGVPALDSNFAFTKLIKFKTVDSAGAGKAAYLDAFVLDTEEGLIGESEPNGEALLSLNDTTCYAIRATDKDGAAEGAVVVAVGLDAASCGEGATVAPTASTEFMTITLR